MTDKTKRIEFVNDGTKPCSACGDGDTAQKYHKHVLAKREAEASPRQRMYDFLGLAHHVREEIGRSLNLRATADAGLSDIERYEKWMERAREAGLLDRLFEAVAKAKAEASQPTKGTTFMCPHCKGYINNQDGLICKLCGRDVTATAVIYTPQCPHGYRPSLPCPKCGVYVEFSNSASSPTPEPGAQPQPSVQPWMTDTQSKEYRAIFCAVWKAFERVGHDVYVRDISEVIKQCVEILSAHAPAAAPLTDSDVRVRELMDAAKEAKHIVHHGFCYEIDNDHTEHCELCDRLRSALAALEGEK